MVDPLKMVRMRQDGMIRSKEHFTTAGNLYMVPATMVDGAAYTLVLNNATGGSYTLSASGMTFKCNPACPIVVTGGKDTIVTMIKAGTSGWVSWVKDFQ